MIVRPKGGVLIFMCHGGACCSMGLDPQQKWKGEADGDMFLLNYKNITIKISKADFEDTFKLVQDVGGA